MINIMHPDYEQYKKEFENIVVQEREEISKIEFSKTRLCQDGPASAIHKKYHLKIKELQQKYKHLFD